jgi:hypothetical protein
MVVVTRSSMDVWNRCKLAVRWLKDVILERGLYVRNSMPPVQLDAVIRLLCFVTLDVVEGIAQDQYFTCE